jgi:hypothetical protein
MVAEIMSRKTGEFGRNYFNRIVERDPQNELGLPKDSDMQEELKTEMYTAAELAASGSTVMAIEVATFVGLVATTVIAVQAKEPGAAWVSGAASVIVVGFAMSLLVQLLQAKLSPYVVGEPVRRWKKSKDVEPSWRRRLSNNILAAIDGYFQRLTKLHTLTPYKTVIVGGAILSGIITVLIA